MNLMNDSHSKTLCALMLLLAFLATQEVNAQESFWLQGREYRYVEDRSYSVYEEEIADRIVPERLIARLKDRGDLREFDFYAIGIEGVEVVSDELFGGYYVLNVQDPENAFSVASALAENASFDYVEFDALGQLFGIPNDQYYQYQWNLPKISMPQAWDISTGNPSVIIAVIDVGVNYIHQDLDGNMWVNPVEDINQNGRADFYPGSQGGDLDGTDNDGNGYVDDLVGWDFYATPGDNDPSPDMNFFDFDHGTAVAGIAAAQTNNYENGIYRGVAGVAGGWGASGGARIMVLRYFYYTGAVGAASAAQCIRYAATNGASVINMSFGWRTSYQYFEDAVNTAANVYHCVLVAAVGNDNGDIAYPAKYPATIAVGATMPDDTRWVSGPTEGSATGPELDVMAPGPGAPGSIWTTDANGDYIVDFGKTSAAAPHVAGLAALIRSVNPSLTWQQVLDILCSSAVHLGTPVPNNEFGYGRINAYKALAMANGAPDPPQNVVAGYTPCPSVQHPVISWAANTEADLAGYNIYKRIDGSQQWVKQNTSVITGNSWTDSTEGVDCQTHQGWPVWRHYHVTAVDIVENESAPSAQVSALVDGQAPIEKRGGGISEKPRSYALYAAYPNPFNPFTNIRFDLPEEGLVSLDVFDVLGRRIAKLINGYREADYHSVVWDASSHASGVYIVRLSVSNESGRQAFTRTCKVLLTK